MATRSFVIFILFSLFIVGCSSTRPVVKTDQYHEKTEQKETTKALNGLQIKALQLMNQQNFEQAIQYLQRAINIDPRNPLNWHYLAQNYWHLKDFASCRSMVQRAISYSQFNPDLNRANYALLQQCDY